MKGNSCSLANFVASGHFPSQTSGIVGDSVVRLVQGKKYSAHAHNPKAIHWEYFLSEELLFLALFRGKTPIIVTRRTILTRLERRIGSSRSYSEANLARPLVASTSLKWCTSNASKDAKNDAFHSGAHLLHAPLLLVARIARMCLDGIQALPSAHFRTSWGRWNEVEERVDWHS